MQREGRRWRSPYQSEAFLQAAAQSGFATSKLNTEGGILRFFGTEAGQVAWEVEAGAPVCPSGLGEGRRCFRHGPEHSSRDDGAGCGYLTLALENHMPRFSKRFRRSVSRANAYYGQASLLDLRTKGDVAAGLQAFEDRPECRDGMEMQEFQTFILNLMRMGCLEMYGLAGGVGGGFVGVACVLRNEDGAQRNLRFYVASREGCAGPLLHFLLINLIFERAPQSLVDLSGLFERPATEKEHGINAFKLQIGGVRVGFERLDGVGFDRGEQSRG